MPKKGVHFEQGEPVERLSNEGALDQVLGVSVDDTQEDIVFLDSVADENDSFQRCPVLGSIDCDAELDGKSIRQLLDEIPIEPEKLFLKSKGESFREFADGDREDAYSVSDSRWMSDPDELIWCSALLAQLKARYNAIAHFLNDPSCVDITRSLSEEERKQIAERARRLSEELQDAALNTIDRANDASRNQFRQTVAKTRKRFLRYVIKSEEAIRDGGLTEEEVNELFEEAGK